MKHKSSTIWRIKKTLISFKCCFRERISSNSCIMRKKSEMRSANYISQKMREIHQFCLFSIEWINYRCQLQAKCEVKICHLYNELNSIHSLFICLMKRIRCKSNALDNSCFHPFYDLTRTCPQVRQLEYFQLKSIFEITTLNWRGAPVVDRAKLGDVLYRDTNERQNSESWL